MARFTNIITMLYLIASQFAYAPAVSQAASSNPVDTTAQVLVAPGATPQAIDYTSRQLDAVTPPQAFTAIVIQWQVAGNLASVQLAVRLNTTAGWGNWQSL
ncbi:MAG: hypothetical protein EBS29_14430, partial [Chloroflexia bacterium]|nr:hypothetical protein [Chloroflexia bacterium]